MDSKTHIDRLKQQYKATNDQWMYNVINLAKKANLGDIDDSDPDVINYDNALDQFSRRSIKPLINLRNKMGLDKIPCKVARDIIKNSTLNPKH